MTILEGTALSRGLWSSLSPSGTTLLLLPPQQKVAYSHCSLVLDTLTSVSRLPHDLGNTANTREDY